MSAIIPIGWDSETAAITRGVEAPPLACVSVSTGRDGDTWVIDSDNAEEVITGLLESDQPMVLHNAAFDMSVVMANYPHLISRVIEAYEDNRVYCSEVREKLIDIAIGGVYRQYLMQETPEGIEKLRVNYQLSTLAWKHFRFQPQGKDDIRTRFGEVIGKPVEAWPAGFETYAADDAWLPVELWKIQQTREEWLADQHRQTKAALWLRLAAIAGLTVSPERAKAWVDDMKARWKELAKSLVGIGFLRPGRRTRTGSWKKSSRNTKAVDEYIQLICEERGVEPWRNDPSPTELKKAFKEEREPVGNIKKDKLTLPRYKDELLDKYTEMCSLSKKLSTDVPLISEGFIQTYFEVLVESGRTSSSSPNIQNIDKTSGVRTTIVPPWLHLFINADYDQFELRTWAQVCLTVLGHSKLAEALNAGIDPHLQLACVIGGISYEEGLARRKAGDKEVDDLRQLAKVCNFGFPGGMGAESFVHYALGYGVILTVEEAKELKQYWRQQWPENWDYFSWIGGLTQDEETRIEQLFVKRFRGGGGFCDTCNTFFQGLAADAGKAAGWEIMKDQLLGIPRVGGWVWNFDGDDPGRLLVRDNRLVVVDPYETGRDLDKYSSVEEAMKWGWRSSLFRTRTHNFIHDEFNGSAPERRAAEAAEEQARLMATVATERFVPDVPAKAAPVLMDSWQKDADEVRDERGRLVCWQPKAA